MADEAQKVHRKPHGKEEMPVVKSGWDKYFCLQQVATPPPPPLPPAYISMAKEIFKDNRLPVDFCGLQNKAYHLPSLALESSVH